MKIRTLTAGLNLDLGCSQLPATLRRLADVQAAFEEAGYDVQTARVACQPVDTLVGNDPDRLWALAERVGSICGEQRFQFVSLGPVNSQGDLALVDRLPAVLAGHDMLNASLALTPAGRVDRAACRAAAATIRRLAGETPGGIGNFRLAAIAGCPPGIPFFPSAYHDGGSPTLAVGLQSADLVDEAFAGADGPADAAGRLTVKFNRALAPIAALAERRADRLGWRYLGIDLSPAPMGEVSIARAFERLGAGAFGEAGTLSIAALTTQALGQVDTKRCGFSGLMFPVLEDAVLGRRNAEGRFGVQELLLYSAVCGTGLDTVPLPGDTPTDRIERLLADLAWLAVRLGKPLSARLFPVPGKQAGEMTAFESPYLTNTTVMRL